MTVNYGEDNFQGFPSAAAAGGAHRNREKCERKTVFPFRRVGNAPDAVYCVNHSNRLTTRDAKLQDIIEI